MLSRAGVPETRRSESALELVLLGGSVREQAPHSVELLCRSEMRSACDGKLVVGEIRPCSCERQRLNRLRRRAKMRNQCRVASLGNHAPTLYDDCVHAMARLDDGTATQHHFQRRARNGSRRHDGRA